MAEHDMSKSSIFASGRAVAGPSSGGHEYYQGSLTHRSNQSFNQESPSSLETRSANSQSQERRDSASYAKQGNQKDSKKTDSKRKRGDSSTVMEPHAENLQKLDNNSLVNPRKGKTSKVDTTGVPFRGADHANFNIAQSVQMEHLPSSLRLKQEDQIQHSSSLCENHDLATKIHEQRSIDPFGVASSSTFEPSDVSETHEVLNFSSKWCTHCYMGKIEGCFLQIYCDSLNVQLYRALKILSKLFCFHSIGGL